MTNDYQGRLAFLNFVGAGLSFASGAGHRRRMQRVAGIYP